VKLRNKSILFIILILFSVNFVIASEITSCQTINEGGNYELKANLRASHNCIVIASDDVNLNGMGESYTITGNNSYSLTEAHGVAITTEDEAGFENVTIRNFVIRNFSRSIYTYNAQNWTIFNNSFYATENSNRFHDSSYLAGEYKAGIYIGQGTGINVSSNYIDVNSSIAAMGIYFQNVTENMLRAQTSGGVSNYIEFNNIVGYSNGSIALIELTAASDNAIIRHNKILAMDGDSGVVYFAGGTNHSTIEYNNISVRGTFVRTVRGKQVRDDPCVSLEGMSSYNKVQFNNCTTSTRGSDSSQNKAVAFQIAGVSWNNLSHNTINAFGENVTGLNVLNAVYNLIEGNKVTMHNNTNNYPIQVLSWGGSATGNNFVNNSLFSHSTCTTGLCPTFRDATSDQIYLSFENSHGLINWTFSTLSTYMNMSFGKTIFIESNKIGVLDDNRTASGFMGALNKTATIKFKGLSYSNTPNLLKSGTDCDGSVNCNISYNSGTGILTADISSFSNYTTSSNDSDTVPEFGDYAMFFILITLVSGFLVIKKKENA